jgi:uncharacterized protein (TIGR03382 family)
MVTVDSSMADIVDPASHTSNIIYLNRCEGGCIINRGFNDSRTNTSSIVGGQSSIGAFAHGDVSWGAVVQCVALMYEPYGIEITDVDPGNISHFEAIVAGIPQDIGAGNGVGGVAPFSCGIINNAITFSFANIYGSPQSICETVAQETAHAFGLEHEFLCEDPMTYLNGCGKKSFQDINSQCGEFEGRNCQCGGATQNSHQELLAHFGPGVPTPPDVNIIRPTAGQQVEPAFAIEVTASDSRGITKAELWINNQYITESNLPPFFFNAPPDLSGGVLNVEVRAYDPLGEMGSATVQVVQGEPCSEGDCGDGEVCVSGRCVAGPGSPGGLGQVCADNDECVSGLCGADAEGNRYCSEPCDNGQCPGGFQCLSAGDSGGVCWPGASEGGCNTSGGTPSLPFTLAFALGMLALVSRRRRR